MRSLGRRSFARALAIRGCRRCVPGAIRRGGPRFGVFDDVKSLRRRQDAFEQLKTKGIGPGQVVEIVKNLCGKSRREQEFSSKPRSAGSNTKSTAIVASRGQWIKPYGLSGDHGITMNSVRRHRRHLPVTHSVPTLSGNVINIVAAGNAVVFNPPGRRPFRRARDHTTTGDHAALGIENLICDREAVASSRSMRSPERIHPPALRHGGPPWSAPR